MSRIDDFEEMLDSYEGRKVELVSPFSFNGLVWQPMAYHEPGKDYKAVFVFDDSQEKLVQEEYERHPFSAEAFGLIIAHLEGKLPSELDKIAEDMLIDPGELFCQAIQTSQVSDRFIAVIYEFVTALPRNAADDGYERAGMKYSGAKMFDVSGLEPDERHYFKDIYGRHDDLIEYLTSRKFDMLPDEIKENGGLGFPNPGAVSPVGHDSFFGKFGIYGCNVKCRASRGVRPAKVKIK